MKKDQTTKLHKLTTDELRDFRVSLKVFIDYNRYIIKARGPFKTLILESLGVNTRTDRDPKVDWEAFLKLNQIMQSKCLDNNDYINFVVRLFDPNECGFVKAKEFETLISALFASEHDEQEDEGQSTKKVESFAEHIYAYARKIGIYEVDGCFSA